MASIPQNAMVTLRTVYKKWLRFPPPGDDLVVVVHAAALRAPANPLTLVAEIDSQAVKWVGALDERMLGDAGDESSPNGRGMVAECLMKGTNLWSFVTPGYLLNREPIGSITVYGGSRPWLVVGELPCGSLLALPLNDAAGSGKWYAPTIEASALPTPNAKRSQLELAHLWSFPASCHMGGVLDSGAREGIRKAVMEYYR